MASGSSSRKFCSNKRFRAPDPPKSEIQQQLMGPTTSTPKPVSTGPSRHLGVPPSPPPLPDINKLIISKTPNGFSGSNWLTNQAKPEPKKPDLNSPQSPWNDVLNEIREKSAQMRQSRSDLG